MAKNLAERAPITGKFIQFWKEVGESYVRETGKVDIPWVTFDGKKLYQRYRPKVQEYITFIDPVTKRRVKNIYEDTVTDGTLLGKASIADARIGLGVNGNHSNDASIVRQFLLWGRKNNIDTATIHDAFFTNIADADKAIQALREIYADAAESNTIVNTLKAMREEGMSKATYNRLIKKAKEDGLIDPPNKITRKDILAPIPPGYAFYGIGP
jgi:DNA-directed RNA polymerase